ncbi:helix-turn-helix domain-containing protein [Methylobacterium gnaphalii]|nr:helix-turn-helix domain-containing protein [Methylobacterium gnaphalii]
MQAAHLLSLTPRTLQTWRLRGSGPAFECFGSRVRYRQATLAAWLSARTVSTAAAGEGAR